MTATATTPLEAQLNAELAKLDATLALIQNAQVEVIDRPELARYGSQYKAVLVSPSGMVWRETYPSNDLAVIAQRVAAWQQ